MRYPIPPDDPDLMPTEVMDMLRQAETFSSSRWLSNATINGDLTIKDSGNITIDDKDSVLRVKGGSIMLRDGVIKGNMLKNQIRDFSSQGGWMPGGSGGGGAWDWDYGFSIGSDWVTVVKAGDWINTAGFELDSWASKVLLRVTATVSVKSNVGTTSVPTLQARIQGGSGKITWTSPTAYAGFSNHGYFLSMWGEKPWYPMQSCTLAYGLVEDVKPGDRYYLQIQVRSPGTDLPYYESSHGYLSMALTEMR